MDTYVYDKKNDTRKGRGGASCAELPIPKSPMVDLIQYKTNFAQRKSAQTDNSSSIALRGGFTRLNSLAKLLVAANRFGGHG